MDGQEGITNGGAIVEKCLVWGGPNYLVIVIEKSIHDCDGVWLMVNGNKEVKEARKVCQRWDQRGGCGYRMVGSRERRGTTVPRSRRSSRDLAELVC